MRSAALVCLAALTLAGCAGGQQRPGPPARVIERVLATAPGEAQPSTIVAREVAYARDARDRGQSVAAQAYAAPGALKRMGGGMRPLAQAAAELGGSALETQWRTRSVVMSCDGAIAIAQGRFADRQGMVGNYITVWERQGDGEYEWTFEATGYDDPQPPQRPQFEDGDIVVTAIDSIKGLVATCPPRGVAAPPPPPIAIGEDEGGDARLSRDGTLRWRWEAQPGGATFIKAEYFYEGGWEVGIEETLASLPER